MRYTRRYNKETKKWEVVMDEGYPSESVYEEFDSYEGAFLLTDLLNREENSDV